MRIHIARYAPLQGSSYIDLSFLEYPVPINNNILEKVERANSISINIYSFERVKASKKVVYKLSEPVVHDDIDQPMEEIQEDEEDD